MSIPPLPKELPQTELNKRANALHSLSIHLLRRAREADKQSGLSPERLSLLSVLTYAGPQSATNLAQLESVSPPAISRIIVSLEKLGLVRKVRNLDDARGVTIHATAKGRKIVETGRKRRLLLIADEIGRLCPADQKKLGEVGDILEKLLGAKP